MDPIVEVLQCLLFATIGSTLGWWVEVMFRDTRLPPTQTMGFWNEIGWALAQVWTAAALLVVLRVALTSLHSNLVSHWHSNVSGLFFVGFYFGTQLSLFVHLNRALYGPAPET